MREKTFTIDKHPRCKAYLKAMRIRVDDPDQTDYWLAVSLSDAFTDDELAAAGTVDFATMTGAALLDQFETLLANRRRQEAAHEDMESLKAFIGSRGVKVSKLPDEAAFWKTASILWPQVVRPGRAGSLGELTGLIRSMSKKARQSARQNLAKVPAEWRA